MVPSQPSLTDEEYQLFNELFSQRFGICFPGHKKEMLELRLKSRIRDLKLKRYLDYYMMLQYTSDGSEEFQKLIRLLTNNETYFFRETHQFEALFDEGLEEVKRNLFLPNSIRLLVAGCSSGEEAYTLNFYFKDRPHSILGYDVRIIAFDLDDQRVAMARQAEYSSFSMRSTTEEQKQRYFQILGNDRFLVKPPYRSGIEFKIGNILDLNTYKQNQLYDVVFCRNVLIYFSEPSLHKAIDNFACCLRPGGLLFLGHSESIIGLSRLFETVRLKNSIVYRRNDQ